MPKVLANRAEIIAIGDKLREVLHPLDNGQFVYSNGYNDEVVAKEIAPRLRHTHVQSIRREVFGPLYTDQKPKSVRERVEELEDRVRQLEVAVYGDGK